MPPRVRPFVRRATAPAAAAAALALLAGVGGAAVAPATARAAATSTVVQGERLSLTPGAGQAVTDGSAAGGAALLIWSNGTASTTVTTTAASAALAAVVRGDQCGGAPSMTVRVDGTVVTTRSVPQTTWTTARVTGSWPAGQHTVSVSFANDTRTASCDRNLRLDQVALEPATTGGTSVPTGTNPLSGARFWVDPSSQARQEMARRAGDATAVAALRKIADTPNAE